MEYIKVNDNGTILVINTKYIANAKKISSEKIYIDYYSYSEKGDSFCIERAEANMLIEELWELLNERD